MRLHKRNGIHLCYKSIYNNGIFYYSEFLLNSLLHHLHIWPAGCSILGVKLLQRIISLVYPIKPNGFLHIIDFWCDLRKLSNKMVGIIFSHSLNWYKNHKQANRVYKRNTKAEYRTKFSVQDLHALGQFISHFFILLFNWL